VCRVEEQKEEREVDGSGQVYMTVAELQEQEAKRRAGVPWHCGQDYKVHVWPMSGIITYMGGR
jgi:hypothetical protein